MYTLYNFAIYLYYLGVVVLSFFNKKVRMMWRGERTVIQSRT